MPAHRKSKPIDQRQDYLDASMKILMTQEQKAKLKRTAHHQELEGGVSELVRNWIDSLEEV